MSASQTPRCPAPGIVIADAPKKATVRDIASARGDVSEDVVLQEEKERFRQMFAGTKKFEIKSRISLLLALNNANIAFKTFFLRLDQGSHLVFNVNYTDNGVVIGTGPKRIDAETVQLGFETFEKGLRNLYYYFKFRGSKARTRPANKEEANTLDMENLVKHHDHIWVPLNGALHTWLKTETAFGQDIRGYLNQYLPTLEERTTSGGISEFKVDILHILKSTVLTLFYIINLDPSRKIANTPGERAAHYRSTDAIRNLFNGTAVKVPQIVVSDNGNEVVENAMLPNANPNFTVLSAMNLRNQLRSQLGDKVGAPVSDQIYYLNQIITILSDTTYSSGYIKYLYNKYVNYMLSRMNLQKGQDVPEGSYATLKQFRGDDTYRNNMIALQTLIGNVHKGIKETLDSRNPKTVRARNRMTMVNILGMGRGQVSAGNLPGMEEL